MCDCPCQWSRHSGGGKKLGHKFLEAHSYGWAIRKESSDFHEGDGADWPV